MWKDYNKSFSGPKSFKYNPDKHAMESTARGGHYKFNDFSIISGYETVSLHELAIY